MVTGIETAGLIIGAIPLVISALEHYEDAMDPARAFLKWKGELSNSIRELYMAHTKYTLTINFLLKHIVSEHDLHEMMEDSKSDLWKDEEWADGLRSKLKHAYHPCMLTIQEIGDIMMEVSGCLNIDGSDSITHNGLQAIVVANPSVANTPVLRRKFEFKKRVKFTMKRRRVRTLLDQLEKCTTRLQDYTEQVEKLEEEPYKPHVKLRFTAPLHCIQGNASKLYQALSQSWCKSHPSHRAAILLEQRLLRRSRQKKNQGTSSSNRISEPNCFRLCLLPAPPKSTWLETEFRLLETITRKTSVSITITLPEGDKTNPSCVDEEHHLQLQQIADICFAIQATQPLLGFYFDDKGLHAEKDSKLSSRGAEYKERVVMLADLLAVRLALIDLYMLAITLTTSLLQLSPTPWMAACWGKHNIAFLGVGHHSDTSVDLRCPYLVQTYDSSTLPPKENDEARNNDCSNILSLAVMLLEISIGNPITSLYLDEDMGPNGQVTERTDLWAAKRWLLEQGSQGVVSTGFRDAITYCLQAYINPQASLHDESFCRGLQEQVLIPLENEMQVLLGDRI